MYFLNIITMQSDFIIMFLSAGAVSGLLSGLLGVGGGIVIVPVTLLTMSIIEIDTSIKMLIALGTSMATIIPTSIRSVYYHNKANNVDWSLFRAFAPGLFFGALTGGIVATNYIKAEILSIIFAIVAMIIAVDILITGRKYKATLQNQENYSWLYQNKVAKLSAPIGFLSALMGIGGGTLAVPVLNKINYPIHKAIGTSTTFGLIIAVPATFCYIYGGQDISGRPGGSIGYVNFYGWIALSIASTLTVPLGAKINTIVTPYWLRILFALFLSTTAFYIFFDII